ncbi:hypothetical protein B4U79_18484 [Dinothrombium tinctorium]|uniref:Uncharacterized protein n=1 Tax=Dinothrombium tinctorium TaxID=1965070 RepID=A0A3S3P6Y5_9ACAR|nr:hypothetical protein B4U79_18507 [Dinothrombium tinctorium]RWS02387.1 hypothetical protein B4U79_18490 [Dinothrombium tinctorium]RWS02422.1 hypothetical protein B4U79_18484 [Dinothrombium tinctorium]
MKSSFKTFILILFDSILIVSSQNNIKQVNLELCQDYPHVTIDLATYSPSNGFVIFYENKMYVMSKPKTTFHYPRVREIFEIRYANQRYFPFDALVRVGECMRTHTKYWAVKFWKDQKNIQYFELEYLSAAPNEIKIVELTQSFLNVQLDQVDSIIDAVILPTSADDCYAGIIYNKTEKGNKAIDIYDFSVVNNAFGYRSYFSGNTSIPTIVGNSQWFDNQILIGCPPTLCHSAEIDAATVTYDNFIILFFANFFWKLDANKTEFPSVRTAKQLSQLPVVGLEARIEDPIYASFTYKNRTYIFGENNNLWISQKGMREFSLFIVHEIFPSVSEEFWQRGIDAMYFSMLTFQILTVIINKEANYFVFNLEKSELDENFLSAFPIGSSYPRPISDFRAAPKDIDAAIAFKNNVLYLFFSNFIYIFYGFDEKTGRFYGTSDVQLIQEILINCDEFDYSRTEYKNKTLFAQFLRNSYPETAILVQKMTIKDVIEFSTFVIALLVIFIAHIYEIKMRKDRRLLYEQRRQKNIKNEKTAKT